MDGLAFLGVSYKCRMTKNLPRPKAQGFGGVGDRPEGFAGTKGSNPT